MSQDVKTFSTHQEAVEKDIAREPSYDPDSARSDTSSDSASFSSQHTLNSAHGYDGTAPELMLTPHLSRTSSYRSTGKHFVDVHSTLKRTVTSGTNATTTDPAFEVDFDDDDKANPQAWSLWIKGLIIAGMSYGTIAVVLYSTSYTAAIPGVEVAFGVSDSIGILGVTTYMLGLACGSIVLAPLSEMYGRRPIYICSIGIFTLLLLPCALAKNIETILVSRFFGAFAAAAMVSNSPGTVNDIAPEKYRALCFSVWSIGPMNGPVIGPVVGGFVEEYLGWRWTTWVVVIVAGVCFIIVCIVPETYAPTILRNRAAAKRKETGDDRYWSRYDDKKEFWPLLKVNLSRPFIMTATEPILIFWDVYIAIVYGILYLCFVAYPIVFEELRGWTSGFTGLAFCGIGVGSMIVICSEPLIRRMINAHKVDPETGAPPPEAMILIVCICSICLPVGELWFAWTCGPNVHWILPIIAGIPFGAGNAGLFIYASNYLVSSYGIYAASALAGNAVLRSFMAATLPLAGPAMYAKLGPQWASTLCGLLEAACIPIPFIFYKYGHKIRMKSALIRSMQEDKAHLDSKRLKLAEKLEKEAVKRGEAESHAGFGMRTGAAVAEENDLEIGMNKI